MSADALIYRAQDAKNIIESPLFIEAFEGVNDYLDAMALSCDPDNAEKARRIVISKQLLEAVKREFTKVINDGVIAEIQMSELEKKKRFAVFRR